jgi:hypothetical protein
MLAMTDQSPFGHAFGELYTLVILELVEEAADYLEAFRRVDLLIEPTRDEEEDEEPAGQIDKLSDRWENLAGWNVPWRGNLLTQPGRLLRLTKGTTHVQRHRQESD